MAPMDEEEDTRLPEENQEVDPSITLCHKIFLLSNPDLCDDVDGLGEEVKRTSSNTTWRRSTRCTARSSGG